MIFRRNTERALSLDYVFEDGQTLREALEGPGVPHTGILPPISPGEALADMLVYKNISTEKCAKRCKLPVETIEDLLAAYIPMDRDIAKGLARGFKLPADFWLSYEISYQESLLHHGQSRPTPADADSRPDADPTSNGSLTSSVDSAPTRDASLAKA